MAGMGSRDIKRKIKSVNSTMQITKAMKLVSTAKLKKTRDRVDITKPYFETVLDTVTEIVASKKNLKHDYLEERAIRKTLYIVITSDRGLCGGYNINALKEAVKDVESQEKATFITIGKKAYDYLRNRNYDIFRNELGISENPTFSDAQSIARESLRLFEREEVDEIKLIYTRLISTMSQEVTLLKLLPIEKREDIVIVDEFVNYDPSPEVVLDYLIPKYMESTIYGALVESAASEQAARRIAMESATDNAQEMIDELVLSFNQARQAAITQEISEIVSGAEALK
ncbi:MAG: ATP synthase F1 subunit gamma [Clostridiales bacterium]|nr:ATP synthase F1 subunit gamma [Clostridiales bacterium]